MIRMSRNIIAAVAAAGFGLGASAFAAGGSEAGAMECAYAAIDETGADYTHVTRSVRRSHAVEEFWLATRADDAPIVYCRYNRRDERVEVIDVKV